MEAWAGEAYTAATSEQTSVLNATALGGVRVLDQLIKDIEEAQKAIEEDIELIKEKKHE